MVFVTRKAFGEAVMAEVERYKAQHLLNEHIDSVEAEMNQRLYDVENRLRKLEGKPVLDDEYIPVQGIK